VRNRAAIIGAGVSGLTCGVVFAERGWDVTIFADQTGQETTSGAAAAVWFPYDAEPIDKVIPWSLITYERLRELARDSRSGISMLELRQFTRSGEIPIPDWAKTLGARPIPVIPSDLSRRSQAEAENANPAPETSRSAVAGIGDSGNNATSMRIGDSKFSVPFSTSYALTVPLIDTTIYLDYLANRFRNAGGMIEPAHINKVDEIPRDFDVIVNCAGIGARELVHDSELEPHRGQVAIVPKLDLAQAIVCDDAPLMYAIPRTHDCVFGGTNSISENREPSSGDTAAIISECSRVLGIDPPPVIAVKVGLRPFRESGVRLEREGLADGRTVIHNYGHGGAGFTLSWACAEEVLRLAS
jgi:D-amino-acid oxidase